MLRGVPAGPVARLLLSVAIGVVAVLLIGFIENWALGALSGIATMSAVFVVSGIVALWPMPADDTRRYARREDFEPVVEELSVVVATLGSLTGIVMLLALGGSGTRDTAASIGLIGVFMNWAVLHLVYTARYAHH